MCCLLEIKTVAANKGDTSALAIYALQALSKALWYDQNTEWNPTTVVLEFLGACIYIIADYVTRIGNITYAYRHNIYIP